MSRRSRARARRGLTLVELIVVLVLLGIVLGVAAPAVTLGRVGEGDGADTIVRMLESSRLTALKQSAQVDVTIDPRTGRVWIRAEAASPRLDTTFTVALPNGATLAAPRPRAQYTFRADGSGWGDTLVVTEGLHSTHVVVEGLTGLARRETTTVAPR